FIGVFVRVTSVLTLGPFFRTTVMIQKGQKLVTTGLYQYIRHPSYLGILITIAGLGLAADNGFTLVAMLIVMGYGVRQRIVVEEEVMEREFKNEYAAYKRRSWRLIPKVY
ncbi:isoprenylcysteine carboxylmethyltransferase family protein, partial [Candidatus Microgenomates bacterium]|nr:isoprenylcysteine carboxylmethyltransferase family protein [Candidatus Microgenomates bacterium]